MELDGYCESLNIAFEHHGEQHYSTRTHYINDDDSLQLRRQFDKEKRRLCSKYNVILIEIPSLDYRLKRSDLVQYISKQLKNHGLTIPKRRSINLDEIFNNREYELIKTLVEKRGGELLSTSYKGQKEKLDVKCEKGHTWHPLPTNLKKGHWCSYCARRARGTIEECQTFAKEMGGKCLSKKYNGANEKLLWQCKKGHQWKQRYSRIKSQKEWCPTCRRGLKKTTKSNSFAT